METFSYRSFYRGLALLIILSTAIAIMFAGNLRKVADTRRERLGAYFQRSGPSIDEEQVAIFEELAEGVPLFTASLTKVTATEGDARFDGVEIEPPFLLLEVTSHSAILKEHVLEGTTRILADRLGMEVKIGKPILTLAYKSDESGERWPYLWRRGIRGLIRRPDGSFFDVD
jgi:hypothetical protein